MNNVLLLEVILPLDDGICGMMTSKNNIEYVDHGASQSMKKDIFA